MPPGLGIVLMDFILFVGWDLVVFEQINFPGGHFGQISGFQMLPNARGPSKGLVSPTMENVGICYQNPWETVRNRPESRVNDPGRMEANRKSSTVVLEFIPARQECL